MMHQNALIGINWQTSGTALSLDIVDAAIQRLNQMAHCCCTPIVAIVDQIYDAFFSTSQS
jgi:hypothetical protein